MATMKSYYGIYVVLSTVLVLKTSASALPPFRSYQAPSYYNQWGASQPEYSEPGYFQSQSTQDWVSRRGYGRPETSLYDNGSRTLYRKRYPAPRSVQSPLATGNVYESPMNSAQGEPYSSQLLPQQSPPQNLGTNDDSSYKMINSPLPVPQGTNKLTIPIGDPSSLYINSKDAIDDSTSDVSSDVRSVITRAKEALDKIGSQTGGYSNNDYSEGSASILEQSSSNSDAQSSASSSYINGGPYVNDQIYPISNYRHGYRTQGVVPQENNYSNAQVVASSSSSTVNQGGAYNGGRYNENQGGALSQQKPSLSDAESRAIATSNNGDLSGADNTDKLYANIFPKHYRRGGAPTQHETIDSTTEAASALSNSETQDTGNNGGDTYPTKMYLPNYEKQNGVATLQRTRYRSPQTTATLPTDSGNQDTWHNGHNTYYKHNYSPINGKQRETQRQQKIIYSTALAASDSSNSGKQDTGNNRGNTYPINNFSSNYRKQKDRDDTYFTNNNSQNIGKQRESHTEQKIIYSNTDQPASDSSNSGKQDTVNNGDDTYSTNKFGEQGTRDAETNNSENQDNGDGQSYRNQDGVYKPGKLYPDNNNNNNWQNNRYNSYKHHHPINYSPNESDKTAEASDKSTNIHIHGGPPIVHPYPDNTQPFDSNSPANVPVPVDNTKTPIDDELTNEKPMKSTSPKSTQNHASDFAYNLEESDDGSVRNDWSDNPTNNNPEQNNDYSDDNIYDKTGTKYIPTVRHNDGKIVYTSQSNQSDDQADIAHVSESNASPKSYSTNDYNTKNPTKKHNIRYRINSHPSNNHHINNNHDDYNDYYSNYDVKYQEVNSKEDYSNGGINPAKNPNDTSPSDIPSTQVPTKIQEESCEDDNETEPENDTGHSNSKSKKKQHLLSPNKTKKSDSDSDSDESYDDKNCGSDDVLNDSGVTVKKEKNTTYKKEIRNTSDVDTNNAGTSSESFTQSQTSDLSVTKITSAKTTSAKTTGTKTTGTKTTSTKTGYTDSLTESQSNLYENSASTHESGDYNDFSNYTGPLGILFQILGAIEKLLGGCEE